MLADDLIQAMDPVIFAKEGVGFNPDPWQAQVLRWGGKRLLLNCHPPERKKYHSGYTGITQGYILSWELDSFGKSFP